MKANDFRRIALSMPGACEEAHMGHADFRVEGKIFATLGYPEENFGVVILAPDEQEKLMRTHPSVFAAAKGSWGLRGNTTILLRSVNAATLRSALTMAWQAKARVGSGKRPGVTNASKTKRR